MPVVHMRIDNRLIHGQVTVAWVSAVGADHILVVNDEVAADPLQQMLLPQAARGTATTVATVDDAVAALAGSLADAAVLLLAKTPDDAFRLLDAGVTIDEVVVGNAAPRPGTDYTMVSRTVAVTPEEAEVYAAHASRGVRFTQAMLPQDRRADFVAMVAKKLGRA